MCIILFMLLKIFLYKNLIFKIKKFYIVIERMGIIKVEYFK